MRLYSVGHGARSFDELLATLALPCAGRRGRGPGRLADGGVRTVVDVRSFPGSRRHPQFGRDALPQSLTGAGLVYRWEPRLGGRRKRTVDPSPNPAWQVEAFRNYADYMDSPEFAAGLADLLVLAGEQPTAFLCAETHWSQCHRRLLSDKLWTLRHEVVHLIRPDKQELHHPPPFLRVDGPRLRYDLPVDEDGQVRLL